MPGKSLKSIRRLVDPAGEYKAIKGIISTNCNKNQRCIIEFGPSVSLDDSEDCQSDHPLTSARPSGYTVCRVTVILLTQREDQHSFTKQTISDIYPGIREIALHISRCVDIQSVLLVKTETRLPGGRDHIIEERFYSSYVDFNGLDPQILLGFAHRKTFQLVLHEFNSTTSEFQFDVILLNSAVMQKHCLTETSSRNSAVVSALHHVFEVSRNADLRHAHEKRKEDIEWFYGQVKKYHDLENLPKALFSLQHPFILPVLRQYQKSAVNWMLCREGVISGYDMTKSSLNSCFLDQMFVPVHLRRSNDDFGITAYFNRFLGYVCLEMPILPDLPMGGILADEMGLGKTVEVLSLILLNPKPSLEKCKDKEDPSDDPYRHFSIRMKRGVSPCEFEILDQANVQTISPPMPKKRKYDDLESDGREENLRLVVNNGESFVKRVHSVDGCTGTANVQDEANLDEEDIESATAGKKPKRGKKKNKTTFIIFKKVFKSKPKGKFIKKNEKTTSTRECGKGGKNLKKEERTYDKVKPMYDAALGEFSASRFACVTEKFHGEFFNPIVGRKAYFECICGEGLEDESQVVTCGFCSSSQHRSCVGIDDLKNSDNYRCPHCAVTAPLIPTKTTLIITPNIIARQWISEIQQHVKQEHMKILYYRGVQKHGYVPPSHLAQYDLIITTYGVLSSELNYVDLPHSNSVDGRRFRNPKRFLTIPSPLPCIFWWRVCLDEAQMIEGITSRMSCMAQKLQAVHYWCVTGTPISKTLQDLYGLFVFLGVAPVNESFWWSCLVTDSFYRKEISLLYELFGTMIWRTGKRDVLDQLGIPPQKQIVHWLNFSPVEAHFYKRLYSVCGTRVVEKVQKICQNSQQVFEHSLAVK